MKRHIGIRKFRGIVFLTVLVWAFTLVLEYRIGYYHAETKYESIMETRMSELQQKYTDEFDLAVQNVKAQYEKAEAENTMDASAEEVAKVLYGIRNNSDDDLRKVVWVIINRAESTLYPNSVEEVCRQPSQWVGYSEENPVLDNLYELAKTELSTWREGGHRPIAKDNLWFDWSPTAVVVKNKF